ncbi:MAG: uroporphyrinogen-III synthase [Beijerinckiaceae bacterium]|nr:uroporphyrinogen-III synthase [Beijerinckiaceae bacterium]
MRVLVLRPENEGKRVAALLGERGHEAVLAPIIDIRPLPFALPPPSRFDATLVTSSNALHAIKDKATPELLAAPLYCVGLQSAETARLSGFARIAGHTPSASSLAKRIEAELKPGSRMLYLAGRPRKPDLESQLGAAGIAVSPVELYEALPVRSLPEAARSALQRGLDVILHFSRASALAAIDAFGAAGLIDAAANARHLCLSGDVASALVSRLDWRIEVACRPDMISLLDLINAGPAEGRASQPAHPHSGFQHQRHASLG